MLLRALESGGRCTERRDVASSCADVADPGRGPVARMIPPTVTTRVLARLMSLPPARDRDVAEELDVGITMDDGVVLLADLYAPAGAGPHPTVLVRSPYGRRGPLGLLLGRVFAERGYRVVMQSCRGTFGSGGIFEPNVNERADGLATIRWIEARPWFDGRLAMNGPSYLGGVQWAVGDDEGPSLRALCTHVTYSDITRFWFRTGRSRSTTPSGGPPW
jgi:predicted acyl esterase